MRAVVRAELRRIGRWPAIWVLCGSWLVLNLTFGYVFTYLSYRSEDGSGFAGGGSEVGPARPDDAGPGAHHAGAGDAHVRRRAADDSWCAYGRERLRLGDVEDGLHHRAQPDHRPRRHAAGGRRPWWPA